jgi:hypothetical protein
MTESMINSVLYLCSLLYLSVARGGSSNPGRVKNFHFSISSRPALGSTQPPIKWVPGGSFPGVRWQGREADRSPPTSAEVKKMWIYIHSPILLDGVMLN